MKSFRVLALSVLALMFVITLTACGGGGGSKPPAPPTPLTITTRSLARASVNVPYVYFLQASGGSGTYTWAITNGVLPPNLTFSNTHGQITGTATEAGSFSITFQVTDQAGTKAKKALTLTVGGAVIINCSECTGSSLPYGNPSTPYSATLTATGGTAPYSWCAIEGDGTCDDGSKGGLPPGLTIATVNSQGVISGTPTVPGTPATVTIQASDSESPGAIGNKQFTLTIFDLQPRTLPDGTLNTPYNQTVSAVGGTGPFTWTLTGDLPAGLHLGSCTGAQRPTCTISGTPTQQGTSNFTLTVNDGETPPAQATANLSIAIGPLATDATLKGTYAIALSGFKSGNPYNMLGSFVTDGAGNISSGKLDYNDGSGEPSDPTQCRSNPICPIAQVVQPGSVYDLSAGDGTGTMTLKTLDQQQNPHTYTFNIAISGNGTSCQAVRNYSSCGSVIETSTHEYGSGVLKVQYPPIFGGFFPGNFALLVNGTDPAGHRYAAAGAIGFNPQTGVDIDCNGNGWHLQDGCPLDTNDNGNNGGGSTLPDPFGGTFSSDVDPVSGRGNFVSMRFPNDPEGLCTGGQNGSHNCGFVYYIVNYEEMLLMSTDPTTSSGSPYANLTQWSAFRQRSTTGWNLTNISVNNIVELSAKDAGKADVTAGLMTTDQAGNGNFSSDENDGGTTSTASGAGTIALGTVGAQTGQYVFSGFPQFGAGGAVMYIWSGPSNNGGYFVGSDAKVTAGVLETQLPPPPPGQAFSNSSVTGNYVGGTVSPILSAVTNSVTYLHADGAGNMFGSQYTSGSGGNHGPNSITLTYQIDSTGRGVVLDQNGNPYGYLYVVGPGKFAMVPTGNAPALNVLVTGQPD